MYLILASVTLSGNGVYLGIGYWILVYLTHLLKLWRCKVGKICREVFVLSFFLFLFFL